MRWVRTVQGRLVIGAAVFFLAFTLAIMLLVRAQQEVLDASRDATDTTRLLAVSAALEKAVVDLEAGQRGYAITHQQRYLVPWKQGRADVRRLGRQLTRQVHSELGEERVRRLRRMIDEYLTMYSEPFVVDVQRGAGITDLRARMDRSKEQIDAIRDGFDSFRQVRLRQVEHDEDAAEHLGDQSRMLAITIWVMLAITLVVLVYLFTRAVVRPITRVRMGVQQVADGDLDTSVDGGNLPETIELAESFNDMTQRLLQAREQLDAERVLVVAHAEALERSNADLQQFAYAAAHDLQEPLRTVASYTELLAHRYRGQLDSDADEFIDYAVQGATRMQELIRALLAYSRVTTRARDMQHVPLGEVLTDVERSLAVAVQEAGARIEREDDLPTVWGDRVQLELVLQNLVGNAIKFHGQDPPVVRVESRAVPDDTRFVEISVIDNGIGIEPQYRDRVFRLFQRLNKRDEYEGTGIGLTLVRRIVERHGGGVAIEGVPTGGTRFLFTIPTESIADDDAASVDPGDTGDLEGALSV